MIAFKEKFQEEPGQETLMVWPTKRARGGFDKDLQLALVMHQVKECRSHQTSAMSKWFAITILDNNAASFQSSKYKVTGKR